MPAYSPLRINSILERNTTDSQKSTARDCNNKVNDYMNKAARKVINY